VAVRWETVAVVMVAVVVMVLKAMTACRVVETSQKRRLW
jgi:hypothetical protein